MYDNFSLKTADAFVYYELKNILEWRLHLKRSLRTSVISWKLSVLILNSCTCSIRTSKMQDSRTFIISEDKRGLINKRA